MNKKNQTHRYKEQISSYQKGKGLGGQVKWVKWVNCMVTDDGGDQSVVNIYVKLQCCTPETYILKMFSKE